MARLIVFLGLVLMALQGKSAQSGRGLFGKAERALDACLSPVRCLGELCSPFLWLERREVRAAESGLQQDLNDEQRASQNLLASERLFALPAAHLREGRRFVHVTVVGRASDDLDQIHVRVDGLSTEGIQPGMPLVYGDVFVGRVRALEEPWPGHLRVDLVTAKDFNVGARAQARVAGRLLSRTPSRKPTFGRDGLSHSSRSRPSGSSEGIRLVVGGLAARAGSSLGAQQANPLGNDEILLALRAPSRRQALTGLVIVDEELADLDSYGAQAQGFHLGEAERLIVGAAPGSEADRSGPALSRLRSGAGTWVVRPLVDYEGGLNQLAVVLPDDAVRAETPPEADGFSDGRWIRTERMTTGDPSPWREGVKIGAGRWDSIAEGAAVVAATRFLGRVHRAGWFSSDVRLLSDAGLSVSVVATVQGLRRPLAMGRLVSLGSQPSVRLSTPNGADGEATEGVSLANHRIVFRWPALVPLERPEDAGQDDSNRPSAGFWRAHLFTGAGEGGVPAGLYLGSALLPSGPGPHLVVLNGAASALDVQSLWVRRPDSSGQQAGEREGFESADSGAASRPEDH